MADRTELEIILNNLLTNAIKYNRENGEVHLRVKVDGEGAHIQVRDTGIGMSQEDQRRLFQDFVRIKNQATREIEGSGLGLAIVRRISELYGGHVSVTSEVDVGSRFDVLLRDVHGTREGRHASTRDRSLAP